MNKEEKRIYNKNYRKTHQEYFKKYYETNKVQIKKRAKEIYDSYTEEQKEAKRARDRNYIKRNQKIISKKMKERIQNDIQYRISFNLRNRVRSVLKGLYKSQSTMNFLGCDLPTLIKHLESQFQEGMTWENYGYYGWHIDHIRPCTSFDLSNPEEQSKCFHYTNLQPLWAKDNFSKNGKY